MSFAARETGTDQRPIEIYDIELPTETYRFTSHDEDVVFGGQTYAAVAISCGPRTLAQVGKVREVTITIARDNALAESLRANGIPPIDALVTLRAFHEDDPEARQLWKGYIGSLSTEDVLVRLRVPNRSDEVFDRQFPVLVAQRNCPHQLYSPGCGVDEDSFKISPTVTAISSDGLTITVSSISGKPDSWARDGKITRTSDGDARTVITQSGTTITIDVPFRLLATSDAVDVFAGCDHTLDGQRGCLELFNNVANFGGHEALPTSNPSAPTGYGVVVQV